MNEIAILRQIKSVTRYGIPKNDAESIVHNVVDIVGTDDIDKLEMSVNYAMSLIYMVDFSRVAK